MRAVGSCVTDEYRLGKQGSPIFGKTSEVHRTGGPSLDPAASVNDLRTLREDLLWEIRKMVKQAQTAVLDELRGHSVNLISEFRQEMKAAKTRDCHDVWDALQPSSFALNLVRPHTSHHAARNSSLRRESDQRSTKKTSPFVSLPGILETSPPTAIAEMGKAEVGKADSTSPKPNTRPAWMVTSCVLDDVTPEDFYLKSSQLRRSCAPDSTPSVEPPQLPWQIPMPPTAEPPEVECNADAAAGCARPDRREEEAEAADDGTSSTSSSEASDPLARKNQSGLPSRAHLEKLLKKSDTRRLSLSLETARRSRIKKEKELEKPPICSMSAKDLLKSSRFDNFMGFVILLNAISIGIQTDFASRYVTDEFPPIYGWLEKIFCVIFTTELILRLYVHRCRFFCKREWTVLWNFFDLFVVAAQLLEEALVIAAQSSGLELSSFRLLRVLRVLRLVRIFRVIRVLHLISELRTIISSIMGSFKSLGWTCVLLFLMIYIVGVYFTQSITDHLIELDQSGIAWTQEEIALRYYFGDLFRAVLSLWQAMSGGADWDSMAGPLVKINIIWALAFAAYIAFAILALMNVVTGVFVQTALQNAKDEEDAFLTDQIIKLFERAENGEKGPRTTITLEEINMRLVDPHIASEWKAINVSVEEAHYLFDLLDIEQSGEIAFEEFLSGCLRLHGTSKSMDLLTVMQECRQEFRLWHNHLDTCERFFAQQQQVTVRLASQLQLNNRLLQIMLESTEGAKEIATMHKESIRRFEKHVRPMEKSFDAVKRMLRSPGGLESILDAMATTGQEEGHAEAWTECTKCDEV